MDKFKNVRTFHLDDGQSMVYVERTNWYAMTFEFDCATLNRKQATALRDWLSSAIDGGAEHG